MLKLDALEYNRLVDDALPLDKVIKPSPNLRKLFMDMDRTKVKLWIFTNAYITHANRVLKLLGLEDVFEGITFCDYGEYPILSKPNHDMYSKAMIDANVRDKSKCHFVDDSHCKSIVFDTVNVVAAKSYGWTKCIHLCDHDRIPDKADDTITIYSLEEMRSVLPEFFNQ